MNNIFTLFLFFFKNLYKDDSSKNERMPLIMTLTRYSLVKGKRMVHD